MRRGWGERPRRGCGARPREEAARWRRIVGAMLVAGHGALSPEEVERYRTDGFFLLRRPVFRPEQFAALSQVMEEHLAGAFGDFDRSDQLDVPHFRDPRLLDFLLSDEASDGSPTRAYAVRPCPVVTPGIRA